MKRRSFMKRRYFILTIIFIFLSFHSLFSMKLIKTIYGGISPKSVVHSGNGIFFAQNMMYRHTVTVYNRKFKKIKTIKDRVKLSKYGFKKYKGYYKGAPVEATFTHNGQYAWVSNYNMSGKGFYNPGHDRCNPSLKKDKSFLYKINTSTLEIEKVIKVGAVPKFLAATPDNRYVIVTNWCSWDISVVDTQTHKTIKSLYIGRYPRGVAISPDSKTAYIAVMGTYHIAKVNLDTFKLSYMKNIGRSPRHLNISPDGKTLYATLNGEQRVAKINLFGKRRIKKVKTGNTPRSMIISDDGKYLYVVNYKANSMSKVRTRDMKVLQTVKTNHHPIGITYDAKTRQVWVACYTGTLMVFQD